MASARSSSVGRLNRYVDSQGRTDAETYLMGVLDGSIVAGRKLMKLARKMLPRIRDGYKQWHYDVDAATRPVEFIERFCKIPSGEIGMPFILEPYERMIVELTFGFVDDDGMRQIRYTLVLMARKNGKALSLDTEIPTPDGWRTMGELHAGDVVFGQDGRPSTIIAESEIFDKPTYLVTFEDGSTVKASGDHIWKVQTKRSRRTMRREPGPRGRVGIGKRYREGGWFETTTQEMFDDQHFVHHRADGKGVEYKYRVPMCLPVEYPEKGLPIDPYTFGVWIGDGTSSKPEITVSDEDANETLERLMSYGHKCEMHYRHDRANKIVIGSGTRGVKGSNPFINSLRELDVFNNKHIPDVYLQGSVEQRWELLRGLMDTDGYVSKAGQCQFTQKNRALVEQFVELCSSLGIKANMHSKEAQCNGKPAGTVYVVEFWTDKAHSCFHLKRKHDRLKDKLADRMSCKSIFSIERIPNEPTKCIAIDNPSHLYLVGRQYTATHNSSLAAAMELYMLIADGEGSPQIYNVATSRGQASLGFGAVTKMVRQSPDLKKKIRRGKVIERSEVGLVCDMNMGYIIPCSKQTDHLDGLDVHCVVVDEMAAMKDRSVYDLLRQGTGARRQPLIIAITTEGSVRDNLWDHEHDYADKWLDGTLDEEDDHFLGILFEQDDRDELFGPEENWQKSNPGLGTVKKWEYLRGEVLKARNDPSYRPTVLTKEFNTKANAATAFLSFEESHNPTTYEFDPKKFRYCIVGIDAADTLDLSAATALFMTPGDDNIYRRSMYWISDEQVKVNSNNKHGRDGVPYDEWEAAGYLRKVQGNKVDHHCFIDWINELYNEGLFCVAVGYDRWGMKHVEEDLRLAVGRNNAIPIPFGAQSLSMPMKQLKSDMSIGRIVDNNNPIDHWCNANVTAKTDINGNVQPIKISGPTSRIDGFAALLCAYKVLMERWDNYHMIIGG